MATAKVVSLASANNLVSVVTARLLPPERTPATKRILSLASQGPGLFTFSSSLQLKKANPKLIIRAARTESKGVTLGSRAPDFQIPEPLTEKIWKLDDFESYPALLVMFICNHCPFVIHLKKDIVKLANFYMKKGLAIVAISSNSAITHPQDGPEFMAEEASLLKYPFPYLYDEDRRRQSLIGSGFERNGIYHLHQSSPSSPPPQSSSSTPVAASTLYDWHCRLGHPSSDNLRRAYLGMTGNRISSPADALYVGLGSHYVPSKSLYSLKEALLALTFSNDSHKDVKTLLAEYNQEPESKSLLKLLLPQIVSSFGSHKSVIEIFEELKKHQHSTDATVAKWANDALLGLERGAPFSLCLTEKHFERVAAAHGKCNNDLSSLNGVMKVEYRIAMRSSLRNDFIEGVRAVLVDKDQKPKWNPSTLEDVDPSEVDSLFEPLHPDAEELAV